MKFKLTEGKIIFHPGRMSDDGQFLDPDGNPYDPIACDPTLLARPAKSSDDIESFDKYDDIENYVPGSDDDNDDEEWINIDDFDPYDSEYDKADDYGFDPEEIDKDKTIETDTSEDSDDDDTTKGDKGKKPLDDSSKPPKDPKRPPEFPLLPPDPPIDPKKMPLIVGKLIDSHTFVTDDGRTIRL